MTFCINYTCADSSSSTTAMAEQQDPSQISGNIKVGRAGAGEEGVLTRA